MNTNNIKKFDELYNKYRNLMYHVAYKVLRSHETAEDVVQESLLKLSLNIEKIGDVSSSETKTFIVIITRNTAIDILRKNKNETARVDMGEFIEDIVIEEDTADKLVSNEGYKELLNIISCLDDIYKDCLILRLVRGYSCEEISKMINVPKKTVEMRIWRGKNKVKKLLQSGG